MGTRTRRGSTQLLRLDAAFLAVYAVDGALLPFLTVFLDRERGLSMGQIGWVLVTASVAALVASPVLSLLADRLGTAKALLVGTLVVSAGTALAFWWAEGFWWVLVAYVAFSVTREPTSWPLLDGIFFAAKRTFPGIAGVEYPRVRIWGSLGFMVPGVILYLALDDGDSLSFLPVLTFGLVVVAIVAAAAVPTGPRPPRAAAASLRETVGAARQLVRRRSTAALLAAMFLMSVALTIYYAYYPLHAVEVIGVPPRWIGLVSPIAVAIELVYMAFFGRLLRRLGWRWLMILGALAAAVRALLSVLVPTVAVLIGVQVLHGLTVVAVYVAGRMLLDLRAADEIRYTTQGIYTMVLQGGGRIVGSAIGGWTATRSLVAALSACAVAAVLAALLLSRALPASRVDSSTTPSAPQ